MMIVRFFIHPRTQNTAKEWVALCKKINTFETKQKRLFTTNFGKDQKLIYEAHALVTNKQLKSLKETCIYHENIFYSENYFF